ncbi:unnamed protein product, partial [Acidithrix sp. C25]
VKQLKKAPEGVLGALATPLNLDGTIDYDSLESLVAHMVSGGADGICPVGSTGEGPLLDRQDRIGVTRHVRAQIGQELHLIPATVSVTPGDVMADLAAYHEVGATSALVPPPFYYPLDANATKDFFLRVADESPLPIVIYNIPQMTKVAVAPVIVGELARHENIIGIKDSSRDFEYFSSVCDQVTLLEPENFSVLTGSDTMLSACNLVGGSGTIAASVNLVPRLVVDLHLASKSGDLDKARIDQARLLRIVQACRVPGFPAGWKAALSLMGLCGATPAKPARTAQDQQIETLRVALVALGVLD